MESPGLARVTGSKSMRPSPSLSTPSSHAAARGAPTGASRSPEAFRLSAATSTPAGSGVAVAHTTSGALLRPCSRQSGQVSDGKLQATTLSGLTTLSCGGTPSPGRKPASVTATEADVTSKRVRGRPGGGSVPFPGGVVGCSTR